MKKFRVVAILFFLMFTARASAQPEWENLSFDLKTKGNIFGRLNKPKENAGTHHSKIESPDNSANMRQKSILRISIAGGKLYFNARELRLGESMDAWKKIIAGNPRCINEAGLFCIWDDLGIEVGTYSEASSNVKFMTIHIRLVEPYEGVGKIENPFGKTPRELGDWLPHRVFTGYLEVDGFGIDVDTKFREIRRNVNNKRNLTCGTLDCSHPSGMFSESATIYLTLDGRSEDGRLLEFNISERN